MRFLLEAVTGMVGIWGDGRVGVRLAPGGTFASMSDSNPAAFLSHAVEQLNQFNLAYLHLVEPLIKDNDEIAGYNEPLASARFRKIFKGTIISAGGFKPDTAEAIVKNGDADLVAFGRYFVSNPDLVNRIREGLSVNAYNRDTFYGGDEHGYTDYPVYSEAITAN